MRALVGALGALFALLSIASCSRHESRPVLRVAAAASLTDAMTEIASELERELDVEIVLRFGASSMLARQLEAGAPDAVFVSADPRWVDALIDAGLARRGDRAAIAGNSLVAIVPTSATIVPRDLRALVALPHIAIAGAEVPAGMHARRALEQSGLLGADHVLDARAHLVESPDVRAALAWVARAEAEGGIVYATDARIEPRVRVAFVLDPSLHAPIVLEAVALHGHDEASLARAFVERLGAASSQRTLAAAGFGPPP